jgi:hypothetical protein
MENDMMGNKQRGTFLSINADGKFAQKVSVDTLESIHRVNKNGITIGELFYDFVKGNVDSVRVNEHVDFGKQWQIVLTSGENKVIINLSYGSNYAKAFLKMLPNIDLSKPVEMTPSMKMDGAEKKTGLFLKQDNILVKYAFNKENPNGMPERKLLKIQGKDTWDYTDQLEFLEAEANKKLGVDGTSKASGTPSDVIFDNITSEELPF